MRLLCGGAVIGTSKNGDVLEGIQFARSLCFCLCESGRKLPCVVLILFTFLSALDLFAFRRHKMKRRCCRLTPLPTHHQAHLLAYHVLFDFFSQVCSS